MSSHGFKVVVVLAAAPGLDRISPWRDAYCMQPLTFTVRNASGTSSIVTSSSRVKDNSRSPSSAIEPSVIDGRYLTLGSIGAKSRMPMPRM